MEDRCIYIVIYNKLSGLLVTITWYVLRFQLEVTAPRYGAYLPVYLRWHPSVDDSCMHILHLISC